MKQELTVVRPVISESCTTSVQVDLSLHQAINAIESLVERYPLERLSKDQAMRLVTAAIRIVERLNV